MSIFRSAGCVLLHTHIIYRAKPVLDVSQMFLKIFPPSKLCSHFVSHPQYFSYFYPHSQYHVIRMDRLMYDCTVRSLGQRDLLFCDASMLVLRRVMAGPTVLRQGPSVAL